VVRAVWDREESVLGRVALEGKSAAHGQITERKYSVAQMAILSRLTEWSTCREINRSEPDVSAARADDPGFEIFSAKVSILEQLCAVQEVFIS
jgi:hypothetical protein